MKTLNSFVHSFSDFDYLSLQLIITLDRIRESHELPAKMMSMSDIFLLVNTDRSLVSSCDYSLLLSGC